MESELAEFVGILLGDGSLGIYRSTPHGKEKFQHRIKITLNSEKDAEYSMYVANLFRLIFNKSPKITKRKGEKTLDLYLLGRAPLRFLLEQGLVLAPKWNRAVVPSRFLIPPLDKLVVRGYMDTDGCICVVNNNGIRYPRIEMKISPSPMQMQLIEILRNNGFEPQINKLERGKVRVVLAGRKNLKTWVSTIGFSNERNIKIADSFLT